MEVSAEIHAATPSWPLPVETEAYVTRGRLVLLFCALMKLTKGRASVALTCCLFVASTPLFVGMSHEYFVEPLQTLAAAWFILLMTFSRQWDRRVVAVQLLAATSLAMLAKV